MKIEINILQYIFIKYIINFMINNKQILYKYFKNGILKQKKLIFTINIIFDFKNL